MKTGPSAPRVWLNPVAVWELLDRLGRARRCRRARFSRRRPSGGFFLPPPLLRGYSGVAFTGETELFSGQLRGNFRYVIISDRK